MAMDLSMYVLGLSIIAEQILTFPRWLGFFVILFYNWLWVSYVRRYNYLSLSGDSVPEYVKDMRIQLAAVVFATFCL